ncbi:MAG: glutaredoxin 3 [Pantoea sp. Brub]|nr:glutaredoxin 3 [Pantoea sp. Brub]
MINIEIYTKQNCPFCQQAKHKFIQKGLIFHEIAIDNNVNEREKMIKRSGRITVPQIFINNKYIGGYDDLLKLDICNGLDQLT